MTNEQAIKFANCLKNNYTIDFNDMADFCDTVIKALEQEPVSKEVYDIEHFARKEVEQKLWELQQNTCDDCISRQAVVEWLEHATDDSIEHAIDSNLEFLPPVTPTHGTCTDCKYVSQNDDNDRYCGLSGRYYDPNYYCADFEKRGNSDGSN